MQQQQQQQQDVLYFSHNCKPSITLLDRLRAREDIVSRLRAVDCTQMDTNNGSSVFAIAADGSRQELPIMITNLPALELAVPPGGKYRLPLVGVAKISAYLGLTTLAAPPRPEVAAPLGATETGYTAAAAAATPLASAIRATPSDTGGAASFVPALPTASLARP